MSIKLKKTLKLAFVIGFCFSGMTLYIQWLTILYTIVIGTLGSTIIFNWVIKQFEEIFEK